MPHIVRCSLDSAKTFSHIFDLNSLMDQMTRRYLAVDELAFYTHIHDMVFISRRGGKAESGRIIAVHTGDAAAVPGVHAVWTASDLAMAPQQGFVPIHADFARPPIADGRVRFVGETIAVVFALAGGVLVLTLDQFGGRGQRSGDDRQV